MKSFDQIVDEVEQTCREWVFDREAHAARVQILHVDLGFKMTKMALRTLQAVGLYPKA